MPDSPANKPFHVLSMSGAIEVVAVTAVTTTLGKPPLAVEGRVTDLESTAIVLDDGSGPVRVYFREGGEADRPKVKRGALLRAVGIVSQYAQREPYVGGYRILARRDSDVLPGPARLPVTGGD